MIKYFRGDQKELPEKGVMYKKDGEIVEVLTSEKSAGDIFFDVEKDQLVLPMNHQNAVWWYQLQ